MTQANARRTAQAALVEAAARDLRGGDPTDADRADVTRVLAFLHARGVLREVEGPPTDQSWLETESSRAKPPGVLRASLLTALEGVRGDIKRMLEKSNPYTDRRTP